MTTKTSIDPPYGQRRKAIQIAVAIPLLYLLVFAVFSPTFNLWFIFDDFIFAEESQSIAIKDITRYFTNAPAHAYRPLRDLIFHACYHWTHMNITAARIIHILLHATNALLLYSLLSLLSRNKRAGAISSLIFALNPVNFFELSKICEIHHTAAYTLIILSLVLYLRNRLVRPSRLSPGSAICFIGALLLYEDAIMVPLILLPYTRITTSSRDDRTLFNKLLLFYTCSLAGYSILRFSVAHTGIPSDSYYAPVFSLMLVLRQYFHYLHLFVIMNVPLLAAIGILAGITALVRAMHRNACSPGIFPTSETRRQFWVFISLLYIFSIITVWPLAHFINSHALMQMVALFAIVAVVIEYLLCSLRQMSSGIATVATITLIIYYAATSFSIIRFYTAINDSLVTPTQQSINRLIAWQLKLRHPFFPYGATILLIGDPDTIEELGVAPMIRIIYGDPSFNIIALTLGTQWSNTPPRERAYAMFDVSWQTGIKEVGMTHQLRGEERTGKGNISEERHE